MHRTTRAADRKYLSDGVRLLEGLEAGGIGVWRWTLDTSRLDWSSNLQDIHGLPEDTFDGTITSFQHDIDPDDAKGVWACIQHSLATGDPYRTTYRTRSDADNDPLWIEARGRVVDAPDGTRYLTGTCTDVTDRVLAQRELERRLRQQKALAEFGVFAFGETSLGAVMQRACEIAADVLDVPLTKILRFSGLADHLVVAAGVGWRDGLVGSQAVSSELQSQAGYTLVAREPVIVADLLAETRFTGAPLLHEHNVRSGISVVIPGSTSRPFGVFTVHSTRLRTFTDADAEFVSSLATVVANSARHVEAADHRLLLVREMAHRAGNMMQLVSTIASQTFAGTMNRETALRAFAERLGALSRANYLVAQGGWTSTRLQLLLAETLAPFKGRVILSGRDVLLPPELCFDLALVVHELTTNSARHGSLGTGGTQAELSWTIERDKEGRHILVLVWHDPVNLEPDPKTPREGFGSRLLDGLIVRKWKGDIGIDRASGYTMAARIPFTPR
ncbi:sensor histidine kinase [Pelagibacterium sediminicola]|uniref:sensor histidine kinase n=1 Tax=Pelagibacterium sediminicola TaxID=2248761 RepID=UPI00130091C7|nr:HWE histidine kinase domain-containing protein [Pelagibacterium sediminicola]